MNKCVLSVKESIFNENRIKVFTFAYGQAPPLMVSQTIKYPFFTTPLSESCDSSDFLAHCGIEVATLAETLSYLILQSDLTGYNFVGDRLQFSLMPKKVQTPFTK